MQQKSPITNLGINGNIRSCNRVPAPKGQLNIEVKKTTAITTAVAMPIMKGSPIHPGVAFAKMLRR